MVNDKSQNNRISMIGHQQTSQREDIRIQFNYVTKIVQKSMIFCSEPNEFYSDKFFVFTSSSEENNRKIDF